MIHSIGDEVWAFDCEWAPDTAAGRRLYHLPKETPDDEVLRVMWQQGGATPENPQPFLKTILCRIVSIAALIRRKLPNGEFRLYLFALPEEPENPAQDEAYILKRFLQDGLKARCPQLVGYNSRNADIRILLQRAFVNGLDIRDISARIQAKPWESRDIDLMDLIAGYGRGFTVSLNEAATLSGIPGKLETTGDDVAGMWYGNKRREIVNYNTFDAITTYLVWLRMCFVSGLFAPEQYLQEQKRVRVLLTDEIARKPENAYLQTYLDAWKALKTDRGEGSDGIFD